MHKNCGIFVSADQLYPPLQSATMKEATAEAHDDMKQDVEPSLGNTQLSKKASLLETLQKIGQQYDTEMEQRLQEFEDQISNLKSEKK